MKLRITLLTAAAVAAVILMFAFSACESNVLIQERELRLLSVTIGDLNVTAIPVPISGEDWDDEEFEVAGADFGLVVVKATGTEDKRIRVTATDGATVTWGMVKGGVRPANFNDLRMPATFDLDDFFYLKVEGIEINKELVEYETTKYYRFYPNQASPVKELAGIAIAGRDPDKVPVPAASMATLVSSITSGTFRGQIDITRGEATSGALVAGTPQDATARLRYAIAPSIATAADFGDFSNTSVVIVQDEQDKDISQAHGTLAFNDGNILFVEVMAQDDSTYYYGFLVTAGRMALIADLKFGTTEGTDIVTGKGTQHAQWASVTAGSYSSADQPAGGFNVQIDLEDPEGSAEWGVLDTVGAAQQPAYTPGLNLTQKFTDKQALAIKVSSPRGNASDARYYKVQVNLLAANFTRHPKSAAYTVQSHTLTPVEVEFDDGFGTTDKKEMRVLITDTGTVTVDRAIEPLTFEVDRGQGGFTYQWYESNSWYGGYGFDRDGRIYGDPGYGEGLSTADRDLIGSGLKWDEKFNISIHNGGNEYYRLPSTGRPIDGANGPSYTPTITARQRPFNTSFTNQTHYYWVVITDSESRQVASKRAAIVTEWDELWDHGKPTGSKVTKKHHIVDLYAYMDSSGNTVGLKGNPRNATPFKAGNHGDQYYVPMTFPTGFNIMEYSIVTCQALFYLADGRTWIQNWTQGDFGFAKASGEGDPENLVLWYNLTNDNATRGLDGTGNQPQGSGLDELPTHLLVQPAGTSPIKQMPPFRPDGQPDKAAIEAAGKTAQGWFTPYIEIVELRFEGPTRVK